MFAVAVAVEIVDDGFRLCVSSAKPDGWMIALPGSRLCEDRVVNRTKPFEMFEGDT
jgi:hypothetical protein